MRSWSCLHAACAAVSLVTLATAISVPEVRADQVDDQRRRVEQIADELEVLDNQLGELEEAHAGALDRIDQLSVEIQDAQVRVDAQSIELAALQGQLATIAVDKFMSGGSSGLSPLFSSVEGITDDLERNELSRVALDQGAGTSDEMLVLVEQFTEDKAALDTKKNEQAQLVASLEAQQQQGEDLTGQLQQKYARAQAELGQAIIDEQERRAAAAAAAAEASFAAAAAAAQQQAAAAAGGTARGGGGTAATPANNGTGNNGTGNNGASTASSDTPAPTSSPAVPAPASTAGIATSAAQGQLGVPYKFAASSPGVAFDCSGLTKYAWGKAGVYLPHQSAAQFASTPHVPKDQAQPGDLIFYYSPIGHVALYLGGGMMIHAPATGDVVKIVPVNWGKVVGVSRPG